MTRPFVPCRAPWTSIAFQPTGVAPCCVYELDHLEKFTQPDKMFQQVRRTFLQGSFPPGCAKCENSYKELGQGYYQGFEKYDTDFSSVSIQEINLRSNNFCNLSCRSCGPHFSSKWEEDFYGLIVITKDLDIVSKLETIDLCKLKTVVFAGGEPTIMPEHLYLLSHLLEIQHVTPNIRISTNLHNLRYKDQDLIKLWKNFPNLYLQISIDAVNDRAADVRSGSSWTVVESNLDRVRDSHIPYYANITVSALNIWFLEDTLDYLQSRFQAPVNVSLAFNPDVINLRVIPNEFRPPLLEMLDRCDKKGYQVSMVRDYLNGDEQNHLWPAFLIYNLLLDIRRGENFCQNLPIFDQIIERWVRL